MYPGFSWTRRLLPPRPESTRASLPAPIKPEENEIHLRDPPTTGEVVAEDAMDNVVAHIEL